LVIFRNQNAHDLSPTTRSLDTDCKDCADSPEKPQNAIFVGWLAWRNFSTLSASRHKPSLQTKELIMNTFSNAFLTVAAAAVLSAPVMGAFAQSSADAAGQAQCILAGRLSADQRWAPQSSGVELLDATGKPVTASSKQALASVKAVRLNQPALLSSCNGNQALPGGADGTGKKSPVPALSAGKEPISVAAVAYPPLRVGGELVELKVDAYSGRVIQLTR
jgi:hypothetical protein